MVDRVTVPAPQVPEQPQTPEQPQPPAPEGPTEEATVPEQPDEPVEIGDNEIPTNEPEDYRDLDEHLQADITRRTIIKTATETKMR